MIQDAGDKVQRKDVQGFPYKQMVKHVPQGSLQLSFYCTVFCNFIFWCPV